jgi:hypothetical protein
MSLVRRGKKSRSDARVGWRWCRSPSGVTWKPCDGPSVPFLPVAIRHPPWTNPAAPDRGDINTQRRQWGLGLVLPAGLDKAVQADKQPTMIVVRRQAPNADTAAVLAALVPTVEELAGRPTPAIIAEDVQPPAATGLGSVTERLGAIGLPAGQALLLLTTVIGTTMSQGSSTRRWIRLCQLCSSSALPGGGGRRQGLAGLV